MNRRTAISTLGAGVVATVAGCGGEPASETTSETAGNFAPYAEWVTATAASSAETVRAFSLGYDTLQAFSQTETETQTTVAGQTDDPLYTAGLSNVLAVGFVGGFALGSAGLSSLVQANQPTERISVASDAVIVEGSFDTESVGQSVTDAGLSEIATDDGYTLYSQSPDAPNETGVTAVGSGVTITTLAEEVSDSVARTKNLIDAASGAATRYTSEDGAFRRLSRTVPDGGGTSIVYPGEGLFSTPTADEGGDTTAFQALPLSGNAVGAAAASDVTGDTLDVRLALQYVSADAVDDRSAIASAVGTTATGREITVEGPTVVVSGSYAR